MRGAALSFLGHKIDAACGDVRTRYNDPQLLPHHQHPAGAQIPVGDLAVKFKIGVFKIIEADKAFGKIGELYKNALGRYRSPK